MRLITIQNKKVLNTLLDNKLYTADFDHIFNDIEKDETNKFKAYQTLMNHYKYKVPPIFCCVLNRFSAFKETRNSKNSVILGLEVPDKLVKLHDINVWTNLQYCISKGFWKDSIYERYKPYLDGQFINGTTTVQAVIPYITPEFLLCAYKLPKNFLIQRENSNLLVDKAFCETPIYSK